MCGITGFWSEGARGSGTSDDLRRMTDALQHRGPDDSGVWVDPDTGVHLGHRRLSIVDLSPDGHQPMVSHDGRYVIVFNGEVYNFADLRRELTAGGDAPPFRGHSDTEVMLAAITRWGLEAAVRRFVGMFAFALWDRRERVLHLVRDRLGIKPLYYGWVRGAFVFGSELKALGEHPGSDREIDRGALALFLRHGYVPAPHSIYRGISKLAPGTILSLPAPSERRQPVPFWEARAVAEAGVARRFAGTPEEGVEELDRLLRDAVRLRMVADVPLGAFLSGGVDSSTVVALMQAQSDRPVRTFSIGVHEGGYDEAPEARAVAEHLGTDHTELYVTPQDALGVIPHLPEMYDEPFADPSQIPTFLVSRLARRDVTVSLSGDGGDELFAGYNRYTWVKRIWDVVGRLPRSARAGLGGALMAVAPETWDRWHGRLEPVLPGALRHRYPGDKLHKLAQVLTADGPDAMFYSLISYWKNPSSVVIGGTEPPTALTDPAARARIGDLVERMMYADLVTYLPEDILTKVDRASMAVSLEARVPLLDHRVVEFAWTLPLALKVRDGQTKWPLRQVLYRYVPRELIERPKAGFGIPLDTWLRGPLREWAEDLLSEDALSRDGFFHAGPIRDKWRQHLAGTHNWQYLLWHVIMFQAWLRGSRSEGADQRDLPLAAAL
jgi:asparagine synthase (glutamine-hydrolysing)